VITLPDRPPIALDQRSVARFAFSLLAKQRWTMLAAGLMGVLWMLGQAALPLLVGHALDAGVVGRDGSALLVGCLAIVALGGLTAFSGVMRHRLACLNWYQAALRSQQVIGHHIADQGLAVGSTATTGEVVETVATDAPRLADLFDVTARASGALISYLAVSVLLLRMDLIIGIWVTLGVPLLGGMLVVLVRPLQSRQKLHRETEGRLTALGADTVAGLRVLRGIGGEQQFLARYRDRSQQVRQAGVRVAGPQAALDAAQVLLPGIFVVVLTWLGAHAALDGRLSAGQLVSTYGFAAFLRLPLETATEVLSKAVRARVAAARIIAVLHRTDDEATATGEPGITPMPPLGSMLHDPESGVTLSPGQLTALVTANPDDAVTITDRLAGLGRSAETVAGKPLSVPRQEPRLGSTALGELPPDAVRERILISEAEPRLFSGPLRAEIDPYGRHPDAAVLAALAVADATDVLDALPEGLAAEVEERGRAFSGGQRQRLVLARAVLADPEVMILVEPTSAVDAHTEARVAERLRAARTGRTTLVTTASPLLLDLCDRVLFLVDGRLAAEGTHRDLLGNPGYRNVVVRDEVPSNTDEVPSSTDEVGLDAEETMIGTAVSEAHR
jgi:ABC-type multidrug transport system fused ATPase/permease subunit